MNQIDYPTPVSQRLWTTRDVLAGATSLAVGMGACILQAAASPLESALANHWNNDYVLASQVAFWLATIPGGLLAITGMFLGVSVVARGVRTFGLAMLGILVNLGGVIFAGQTIVN